MSVPRPVAKIKKPVNKSLHAELQMNCLRTFNVQYFRMEMGNFTSSSNDVLPHEQSSPGKLPISYLLLHFLQSYVRHLLCPFMEGEAGKVSMENFW